MNEILNKFLLVGEKFMPEMHLKQLFNNNILNNFLLIVLVVHSQKIKKELKVYANWKYRFYS